MYDASIVADQEHQLGVRSALAELLHFEELISDTESGYRVTELRAFGARLAPSTGVEAWNDQPRLLSLLADPAVRRFYFQVFRHPVARIEESPARLSLILQEAGDQVRSEPGRTFTYETTPDGEETVYRVARFD